MRYVVLIYRNPESRAMWETMSDADRSVGLEAYHRLNAELTASGELVATEALSYPEDGRQVVRQPDGTIASDGPYAEVKEHLAGFYLVDVAGPGRAAEIAGRIPESSMGLVEVRPTLSLADFG